MPPPPHTKPENVLKRAQELIAVEQSPAALTILHEHVTSKRSRNSPITSLEPVMIQFVELCVDLKKGKLAKDGLYQYKNTAQNTNVGTIELVLKKFIELAEAKVTEAQAKADEVQSNLEPTASGANVEDLEAIETPESILLSTVSGEQSRDRTDRAIVTPWLKFLWETYRTVLEILKNNARLEVMYQSTAMLAFTFCQQFVRKTEFRRLCELLRNHVQNAAKYQSQMHAINLSDPDTLQRHLDTRFQQLNVAVELELWQEAFRSVEDIHTLLSLSKRPAKNVMMANYYEKLTRIFLVSENYLFHAASWSRYYNLLRQSANTVASGQSLKKDNPAVTEADMSRAASFVLLSALSIPVISTSRSRGALIDVDEARKNKNNRLTNLLGMSHAPTRAVLFKDAMSKGLLKRAKPEIRELYQILEVDFHPLSICKKISPILAQIGADPEMEKYVLPLQQVILTRLFQQLSQVYESVELSYVHLLAQFPEPFQVTAASIEKFIMNGCKKGDLTIRIDHATGVLTFDSDVFSSAKALHPGSASGSAENETSSVQRLQRTPAEIVRSQLTRLAKTLYVTCQYVDPEYTEARQQAKAAALSRAQAGAEQEHQDTLARRAVIEKKKELASDALQKKQKEEETRKRIVAQQRQEAEALRLAEEHKERERKRMKDEQDRIRRENNEKELSDLVKKGINIGDVDVKDLDSNQLRLLRISQLEKEKNDLFKNLRVTGKRIDHLERAFRKEEVKLLPKDYEAQRERDFAAYETSKAETRKVSEMKYKKDLIIAVTWASLSGSNYINPRFRVVFQSQATDSSLLSAASLVFCPGFFDVLQTVPPTQWFESLSAIVSLNVWAVYVLVLRLENHQPYIYIGSGTNAKRGVKARLSEYDRHQLLPDKFSKAFKDGYTTVHKALLLSCPIPTAADIPKMRMTLVAVEAAVTCIFGGFFNRKKNYGFGNLCPWAQDSFDWNGLCSHIPLLEPVVGDLHLSSEQAEAMAAETAENNRQYGLEYAKNLRANPTKEYLEDVSLKHRLSRLLPVYEQFHKDLKERRHDEFEKRRKAADREFQSAVDKRKREARERKAREQREREETERRAQEEEERIAREAEEKAAADEEKSRLLAEAKAKRDAQRRDLDEKAAIQNQKDEAAEAKIKAMRSSARLPERPTPIRPAESLRTESSEGPSGPPKLALAGSKPTWRDREAARKQAEAAGAATQPAVPPTDIATEEVQLPKKTSGYVPPARRPGDAAPRGRSDAAPSPAPREESSGAQPPAKWRPSGPRDGSGRDGSPANRPTPRFLDGLRGAPGRDSSPAEGGRPVSSSGTARTESPANEKPAPGKYVPVHLRNRG